MQLVSFIKKILANVNDFSLQILNFQVGKKPEKITYVGIHNRRTDYLEFRRKRLGLDNLYEDYFEDAMEYFRDEYWDTTVVFVYVSDDMKWGRRNLKDSKNLFFLGLSIFSPNMFSKSQRNFEFIKKWKLC